MAPGSMVAALTIRPWLCSPPPPACQQGRSDGRPRRGVVIEVFLVHLVELGEPCQVCHVSVDLHDVLEARAGGFEDRLYVLERLTHLVREGVRHGARLRVHRTLPRDEHKVARDHGVGVWSCGSRPFLCHNGLSHRFSLLARLFVTYLYRRFFLSPCLVQSPEEYLTLRLSPR